MKFENFLKKFQSLIGLRNSELTFVIILLAGLFIGLAVKIISKDSDNSYSAKKSEIYNSLDSLAELTRTTFIGTDPQGNPIQELAVGDTLVTKESAFPQNTKKGIPDSVININTASKVQLMKLPGIGESTADKIIEFRKNSLFDKPEDIMKVKGIGQKKFEKMKPYIDTK